MAYAMLVAIDLVYLIMVILFALSLAVIGAFVALAVTGRERGPIALAAC